MAKRSKISLVLSSLFVLIAAIVLLFPDLEPEPLEFDSSLGIPVMSPSVPLPDVSLNDQRGQLFQTRDLKGKWNLMFFGYTNCPDICPTTLSTLKQVAKQLPDQPIRYIFVTVDPKRDTTEKLEKYLDFFSPDFIGLTGQKTEIDRLSQKVGAIYDYEGDTSGDDYIVNHYAAVLVVDPQARLRAHILPPHTTGKITNGIIKLMDYYGD